LFLAVFVLSLIEVMERLQKISVILLGLLLVILSSGYSVHRVSCLMSGMERYSMAPIEDCCPDDMPVETGIAPVCCAFDQFNFDLSLVDFPGKELVAICYVVPSAAAIEFVLPTLHEASLPQNHSPHLPSGHQLLPIIQQWLI
jgi:hypothetical protein